MWPFSSRKRQRDQAEFDKVVQVISLVVGFIGMQRFHVSLCGAPSSRYNDAPEYLAFVLGAYDAPKQKLGYPESKIAEFLPIFALALIHAKAADGDPLHTEPLVSILFSVSRTPALSPHITRGGLSMLAMIDGRGPDQYALATCLGFSPPGTNPAVSEPAPSKRGGSQRRRK